MTEWPLHDAKNRFSAVVTAAVAGEPQRVTRHGKPAVVVISVGEYERLRRLERATAPTFAELLLSMPDGGDGGEGDGGEVLERLKVAPRPVEL